jgi:hypothetical protein
MVIAALAFAFSRSSSSQAAHQPDAAAPAASAWYTCVNPDQVAVFLNRVHVHCGSTNPTIAGVTWFAVPTAPDSAAASRFMSLFQSAMITGRPLLLWLDPADLTGGTFGCGTGDCRRITGAEMQ